MKKILSKAGAISLTAAMVMMQPFPALAAGGNDSLVDDNQKGSITIYKYDITAAEAAGAYSEGKAEEDAENQGVTYLYGEKDADVEEACKDYALSGVQFTAVKTGDAEQYSENGGKNPTLVYEIPDDLERILGLDESEEIIMHDHDDVDVSNECNKSGVSHYEMHSINEAIAELLASGNTEAKNKIEAYVSASQDAITFDLTDANGKTSKENLDQGLYLIAETMVPENVTDTVNPWFASLPFTKADGSGWMYDMTCYPKNQSGMPDLDKKIRNKTEIDSKVTITAEEKAYGSTVTASEGDVLDYIIVSKLPHISSDATSLKKYEFNDQMDQGLSYNQDLDVALYHSKEDAAVNNTAAADAVFSAGTGDFTAVYGDGSMKVTLTQQGLEKINAQYSDYYIVLSYTVTVGSNDQVVLGDDGNVNDVTLTFARTNGNHEYDLEDECIVYTYGLNLTKSFNGGDGDATKVTFSIKNVTDNHYVLARKESDGRYYVTGFTDNVEDATRFSPSDDKTFLVKGLEADEYALTELTTDSGYSVLVSDITLEIDEATKEIIPSVAGATGFEANTEEGRNLAENYNGGITDARGTNVNSSLGSTAHETANGDVIGKTAMYLGSVEAGTATASCAKVDGIVTDMAKDGISENAVIEITVVNNKTSLLPKTGGNTLYGITVFGILAMAGGIFAMTGKKDREGKGEKA